ncbi:MAG: S8 family serine peptidase, partial [Bacteroidota bacterium]
MKHYSTYLRTSISVLLMGVILALGNPLQAQTMRDYVVFGGAANCPNNPGQTTPPFPGCGVQIGSSTKIDGGAIGSYQLIKSTGNTTINSNLFSGGTIDLANSNIVKGKISVANLSGAQGTILSIGSSVNISGTVDVNGNIVIGGGTVSGKVTHPPGTTYFLGGILKPNTEGVPTIVAMPTLPQITEFPPATNTHVTSSQPLNPGSYGDMKLNGNQRLTFNGPGEYTFNSILNTGNSNIFIFDFQDIPTGVIKIYVHGTADLGKIGVTLKGGGGASRIFFEGHGAGAYAVNISNGSSGQGSKWLGTVWAPFSAINVGSGTGSSNLTGAFWSGTQVNLQSGVSLVYEPLVACSPVVADAGPDQTGASTCGLTSTTLAAKLPGSGTGSWSIVSGTGGSFSSLTNRNATFTGTPGVAYKLQWFIENGSCGNSADEVLITFNQNPVGVSAGDDKALEFDGQTKLTGSLGATGASYSWASSAGGVISTPVNTNEISVSSQGTYTYKVTNVAGCSATDVVNVTSKLKQLIGSELQAIYDNKTTDNTFFDIKDGYVKIDIIALAGKRNTVLTRLLEEIILTPGLRDTIPNGLSALTITGRFPIDKLPSLNLQGDVINYVRPYYRAILFNEENPGDTSNVGLVRSAGDTTMKTHLVKSGYSVYGDGIKIGVISDSYSSILSGSTATLPLQPVKVAPFVISPSTLDTIGTLNPILQTFNTNTAAADVLNRDLPPNVHLLPVPNLFPVNGTDEGRAMMQIVHDVAPGAELYFRSGFNTAGDFASAILQLRDQGCKIIVDDITYPTEPILRDGIVARTVNTVKASGVTYFSSAGNFGSRSYEKNFNPITFNGKVVHNFGGGDVFQKIKLAPGDYTFVFQWVDDIYSLNETGGTRNDLDIYLTKQEDGTGLIGFNRDNLVGDPIEFIPITIDGTDSVIYNLFIVNNTPGLTPNLRMKVVAFRGTPRFLEFNEGTSTVIGQANAEGAIAVGATRFNHVPGHPLLTQKLQGITKPQIETFSSTGGTWVNGAPRQKPDLVGPDGGNTTVKLGQDYPDWALDGFSNFFGTSAAAPHAAAAAALIIQGRQKFLGLTTTPDQIKTLMQST